MLGLKKKLIDDIYITGNVNRFERLLINLIKNAIEAMEQAGVIEVHMNKNNKFLTISIIDSGPGIPPEKLDQIFYPFFTTKDDGTGIGLSICKTIIETLNGTMSIQNHETKGVIVKLKIPLNEHTS
ncbi:MAG: ATP-binding protein [Bacillaceae bacterium]|nr:ATP-binding protein [Bacillaceae bacterium]